VLFLHGYLSSKESFYYQINCLVSFGYRVTAPDILGFGGSSPLTKAMSVGDFAEWLKSFILAADIHKPHIVAHSFGARVAVKLVSKDNSICDKLVITGGAGLVKKRTLKYKGKVAAYRAVKKFFPTFAENHFGSKEYRTLSHVMKESYKKIVNEDLTDCLKSIKNPTLLLYGENDKTTPYNQEGKVFNSLISGSNLIKMKGGHFCFSDYPQQFNKQLLNFLQ
jgi:pimeloyl-ACP methyl ester carboxylesterase